MEKSLLVLSVPLAGDLQSTIAERDGSGFSPSPRFLHLETKGAIFDEHRRYPGSFDRNLHRQ
jgi:hypothetical protein